MESYHIQYNVGKCKYVLNVLSKTNKHKDGSDFYDIYIFKNKVQLNNKVKELIEAN